MIQLENGMIAAAFFMSGWILSAFYQFRRRKFMQRKFLKYVDKLLGRSYRKGDQYSIGRMHAIKTRFQRDFGMSTGYGKTSAERGKEDGNE